MKPLSHLQWAWLALGGATALYLLTRRRAPSEPAATHTSELDAPGGTDPMQLTGGAFVPPITSPFVVTHAPVVAPFVPPITSPFAVSYAPAPTTTPAAAPPPGACVLVTTESHYMTPSPESAIPYGTVPAGATLYVVERRSVSGLDVFRADASSPGLAGLAGGWFSPLPAERALCP
jgi:hypothetical protein